MHITFTLPQLVAMLLVAVGHIALAYVLGVWQGRIREACEPTQEIADDDGKGLGGGQ